MNANSAVWLFGDDFPRCCGHTQAHVKQNLTIWRFPRESPRAAKPLCRFSLKTLLQNINVVFLFTSFAKYKHLGTKTNTQLRKTSFHSVSPATHEWKQIYDRLLFKRSENLNSQRTKGSDLIFSTLYPHSYFKSTRTHTYTWRESKALSQRETCVCLSSIFPLFFIHFTLTFEAVNLGERNKNVLYW